MMTILVRIMASFEDVSDNNNKILPSTRRKTTKTSAKTRCVDDGQGKQEGG